MTTDNNEVEQLESTEPLLDRDTYRRIKKMDRATLEGVIQDIFERGRKKGLAEAGVIVDEVASDDDSTLDLRAVELEIRSIRGIGEKLAEDIMLLFENHLEILGEDMNHK
ncbi:hypothetical protein [uncultured Ruminococcus sp.]|uniref:hypothetical protein n=1 Tax=uncultured Ruminococcus sp. TaxID=165186 RepID=UPI0025DF8986|nr:hypothetical protein [uncultured Ruminococcus sp.]